MGQVWDTSNCIYRQLRHYYMTKLCESIGWFWGPAEAESSKCAPLRMVNGVLWRKEEWPLLLRCFKIRFGDMWHVWEASLVIIQPPRHHYMPKRLESIGSIFVQGQPSGLLSACQMVWCDIRMINHCSWGVSKTLVIYMGQIWEASFSIKQSPRSHSMLKWS